MESFLSALERSPWVERPRHELSILLEAQVGTSRAKMAAGIWPDLDSAQEASLAQAVARRAAGEPLAYILGFQDFWEHRFVVDSRVLIPRPDTEILVEWALEVIDQRLAKDEAQPKAGAIPRVHDCCTGSGAIAISLAAARKGIRVTASDISIGALDVARANEARIAPHSVPMVQGDLFATLETASYFLLTANPPYISMDDMATLEQPVRHEPEIALYGGEDGLSLYHRMASQGSLALEPGGWLLSEIGWDQGQAVMDRFADVGLVDIAIRRDLAGRDRVVGGRKPW